MTDAAVEAAGLVGAVCRPPASAEAAEIGLPPLLQALTAASAAKDATEERH
jgi:hypothetical protein